MKINKELQALVRPIEDLVSDPANVRVHSPRNIEAIKGSLARFGQQKPIVVNSNSVVIAGNGTIEAARALGATEIAALVFDGDTEAFAAAFAIADNRTGELAEWDYLALSEQLKAIELDDIDLSELGWDKSDLALLLGGEFKKAEEGELPGTRREGQHGVAPIVISQDQRDAFEQCCAIIRGMLDEDASDQRCFSVIVDEFLASHSATH